MGHRPNAANGRAVIVGQNKDILEAIAIHSDIAMAKQDADRDASIEMIKKRHVDELKAAKRNHKHRAKRIVNRMKGFEDMDPLELANRFKDGVPDDIMEVFLGFNLLNLKINRNDDSIRYHSDARHGFLPGFDIEILRG